MEYETRKTLDDFVNIYTNEIMPTLSETEHKREKMLIKYVLITFLFIFLFVASIFGSYILLKEDAIILLIMIGPFVWVALLFFYWSFRKVYIAKASRLIKTAIYPKLFDASNNIKWLGHDPNQADGRNMLLSDNSIENSRIFDHFGTRFTDDEFQGKYRGMEFVISETKLFEKINTNSTLDDFKNIPEALSRKYPNFESADIFANFRGIVLHIKSNKSICNDVLIKTKGFLETAFKTFFEKISNKALENTEYDNLLHHYKIISKDKSKISLQLLEALYKLEESFYSEGLKCSINGRNIIIAIKTKDNLFEIGNLFNSLYDIEGVKQVYNQLNTVYKFIDCIKNNKCLNEDFEEEKIELQDMINSLDNEKNTEVFEFYTISIIFAVIWIASIITSIIFWMMKLTLEQSYGSYLLLLWIITISASILIPVLFIPYFNKTKNKIGTRIKSTLAPKLLKTFDNIKWFSHDKSVKSDTSGLIEDYELRRSGLFMSHDCCFIDDEFSGKYKDIRFDVSEIQLCKEFYANRGQKTYMPVFRGVIMNFKINKVIKNRTIVASKGSFTNKNNSLIYSLTVLIAFLKPLIKDFSITFAVIVGILMIIAYIVGEIMAKSDEPLDKINLEDPIFQKKFNAYSSDQVEARYLLTPTFMEKITNLKRVFGSKKIKCSFYDNNFMIAMETKKDVFEIGSFFKPLNNQEVTQKFIEEIKTIYDLIEYFKLDD